MNNFSQEEKKIYEQKQVEKSDNKLTESLFSNNPHIIDKSPNTNNIVKIGKNKFVSVIKPLINKEKKIILEPVPIKPKKKENKSYDLNDYDYDCDIDFLVYD
jgi:hypothetical protein